MRLAAVDPGDEHVGFAFWLTVEKVEFLESRCEDNRDAVVALKAFEPTIMVVEAFHLHPWKAETQTWSQMKTPELIGRLKQVADDMSTEVHSQTSDLQRLIRRTPYYKRHVASYGKPRNPHAESALCHGLYFLHMNPKGLNLP